jgi:hypothetical protein
MTVPDNLPVTCHPGFFSFKFLNYVIRIQPAGVTGGLCLKCLVTQISLICTVHDKTALRITRMLWVKNAARMNTPSGENILTPHT